MSLREVSKIIKGRAYIKRRLTKSKFEIGDTAQIKSIYGSPEYESVTIKTKEFRQNGWVYGYDLDDGSGDGIAHESEFIKVKHE